MLNALASLVAGILALYLLWQIEGSRWYVNLCLWICWALSSLSFATGLVGVAGALLGSSFVA